MNTKVNFDDIARSIANRVPRRQVLKQILGLVAGMSFGMYKLSAQAGPGRVPCTGACEGDIECEGFSRCLGGQCCLFRDSKGACCCQGQRQVNGRCCDESRIINEVCCDGGREICGRVCCRAGDTCNQDTNECNCPPDRVMCDVCCDAGFTACDSNNSCCMSSSSGRVSAIRSGPPTQADITIRNGTKGLAALSVLVAVNCRVDMPAFTWGTKGPVICTATKIDQSKVAQFVVMATDTAGCPKPCDPVVTTLEIDNGRWVRQTFEDIPQAEGFVSIQNNAPGLRRVVVEVNGKRFRVWHLKHNELRLLDVASAMQAKDNVITLTGYGKPGASATVLIADVPTEAMMSTDMQKALPGARRVAGQAMPNMAWGKMMRETRG